MLQGVLRPLRRNGLLVVAVLVVVLVPALRVWPARGITVLFYDNPEWRGEPLLRQVEPRITLETIERDQSVYPQRDFSAVWGGWIRIDRPGRHVFSTRSDDGSALRVGQETVVENGGYHPIRERSGAIDLQPGFHLLRVYYMQGRGAYQLRVQWTEPGESSPRAIPTERLYVEMPSLAAAAALARHAPALWALGWLGLVLELGRRAIGRRRGVGAQPLDARRVAMTTVTVAGSIVVALVVAEAALRFGRYALEDRRALEQRLTDERRGEMDATRVYSLGGIVQPSEHEGIVYELRPNLRGVFVEQPLSTNSRGLRDREYAYAKPDGTRRIVGLGDSSLFGWGVRAEDTSLKVLERMLNARGGPTRYEVINFAAPGYNTAIEAEVFVRKALRYDPDIVLVNFNTNDYDVPAFMKLPQNFATLRRSYLFDFVYERYRAITGVPPRELPVFDFATRTLTLEEADRLDEDPGLPDEYRDMVGVRGFERAMRRIVEAAHDAGVAVVVFDVKVYPGLHPTYAPNAFRDSQRELLERLSAELGFHWLNTYPHYVDYMNRNPDAPFPRAFSVSDTDSHPSVLAHRLNAEAVYAFLVEEGLLEDGASSRGASSLGASGLSASSRRAAR